MKTIEELEQVNTTNGTNGYPSNVKNAYIGFDNADELNAFAKEHKCNIVSLHKRDGWHLWEREYVPFAEEYEIGAETYGDDYASFDNWQEVLNEMLFIDGELKSAIKDGNMEEISNLSKRIWYLAILANDYKEELEQPNTQIITTFSSDYADCMISAIKSLNLYCDTHHYTFGVELVEENDTDE